MVENKSKKIPLPMLFPDFLKIDISDLTALLGGVALGPMAGVTIALLKNLLQFVTGMSTTGGVGEFANFFSATFPYRFFIFLCTPHFSLYRMDFHVCESALHPHYSHATISMNSANSPSSSLITPWCDCLPRPPSSRKESSFK